MFNKDKFSFNKFSPLKGLLFLTVFLVMVSVASFVVMLLWNAILPDVVGVQPLNFWQAGGLLLLAKILFGGFGGRRGHWKNKKKEHWKNKWMPMNDEEREEMKARWKEYCKKQ